MAIPDHIPQETVDAVRRLDIEYANNLMRSVRGYPFVAGPCESNGLFYTADENALVALHKLRTKKNKKKQSRESKDWLKARRMNGLFEQPLELN